MPIVVSLFLDFVELFLTVSMFTDNLKVNLDSVNHNLSKVASKLPNCLDSIFIASSAQPATDFESSFSIWLALKSSKIQIYTFKTFKSSIKVIKPLQHHPIHATTFYLPSKNPKNSFEKTFPFENVFVCATILPKNNQTTQNKI